MNKIIYLYQLILMDISGKINVFSINVTLLVLSSIKYKFITNYNWNVLSNAATKSAILGFPFKSGHMNKLNLHQWHLRYIQWSLEKKFKKN